MRLFLCLLALVLLPGCGGGPATGEGPKSAADDANGSTDSTESASDGGQPENEEEESSSSSAATEKSQGPNCDDGTCSKCGSGICPAGWYCDEGASGGSACSWLAQCAEKPSCGCVTRVLGASCKCREEGGGLKVACE